jgi:hypothetical protein
VSLTCTLSFHGGTGSSAKLHIEQEVQESDTTMLNEAAMPISKKTYRLSNQKTKKQNVYY